MTIHQIKTLAICAAMFAFSGLAWAAIYAAVCIIAASL